MRLITKAHLADLLQVTPRTINNYHHLALDYLEDFANDYPVIRGDYYTRVKLTEYQVWVLRKVYYLGQRFASRKVLPELLLAKSEALSKAAFQAEVKTVNIAQLVEV